MQLYLLRHGIAVSKDFSGPDSERPLTQAGIEKLRDTLKKLRKLGLSFDHLVSSPYLRAYQTAECARKGLRLRCKLDTSELLTPEANPERLLAELKRGKTLWVGHNPSLSVFLARILGLPPGALYLEKAGLAGIHLDQTPELIWFSAPKLFL